MIKINDLFLFFAVFGVVLNNSYIINTLGINNVFKYSGYALFLWVIFIRIIRQKTNRKITYFVTILFLLSIGIFLQNNLPFLKKINLFLSMFILESFMFFGGKVIQNTKTLYFLQYGILAGTVFNVVLALLVNSSYLYVTNAGDGLSGITMGFSHKNYFAGTFLCLIAIQICYREITKSRKYNVLILIEVLLIFLSGSRASWLMTFFFIVMRNMYRLLYLSKRMRMLIMTIILLCIVFFAYLIFKYWAVHSVNYTYRINGLINYIATFKEDIFHIVFGNAEMAYRGLDYVINIRSVIGWNSSPEMAVLNILIKNGLIGFIGYFLAFKNIFNSRKKKTALTTKFLLYSLVTTLLLSAFVESYLVNLEFVISPIFFILIWLVVNLENDHDINVMYRNIRNSRNSGEKDNASHRKETQRNGYCYVSL